MRLKVIAATALTLFAAGCGQSPPASIPRGKALELAQQAATQRGYNLDKYMLSEFGEELSKDGKEWVFAYQCKPVPAPGCHFLVVVDRSTGATHVVPGE